MNETGLVRVVGGFLVVWAALAVVAWLHLRALRTPTERKKWFDRYAWLLVAFVAGTGGAILVQRGALVGALATLPVVAGLAYFRIRRARFCPSCGKFFSAAPGSTAAGRCAQCAGGTR